MASYTQHIDVSKMQNEFSIDEILSMVKKNEYDPELEMFTLEFSDTQIERIARAQMNLVMKDLNCEGLEGFKSEYYKSAYHYVGTESFIELCKSFGLNEEAARYQAKWLLYRYTPEYVEALEFAVEGESSPQYIEQTRFAYELANYLFEKKNDIQNFKKIFLSQTSTYWDEMSKQGLKSYACRTMLCSIIEQNKQKFSRSEKKV